MPALTVIADPPAVLLVTATPSMPAPCIVMALVPPLNVTLASPGLVMTCDATPLAAVAVVFVMVVPVRVTEAFAPLASARRLAPVFVLKVVPDTVSISALPDAGVQDSAV
ncbi:hypothetical protein CMPELA_08020 [Cupriavidus necator]|nr:hypothetical protein [Cupriavidus necator]QQB76581.1 hypothetical protein I6H87_18060 [Cupriavidus necator]WKA42461.1 hypothetical protein QWP09_08035 [Cupriavidus necator]